MEIGHALGVTVGDVRGVEVSTQHLGRAFVPLSRPD
jgi:hypothetical protein